MKSAGADLRCAPFWKQLRSSMKISDADFVFVSTLRVGTKHITCFTRCMRGQRAAESRV